MSCRSVGGSLVFTDSLDGRHNSKDQRGAPGFRWEAVTWIGRRLGIGTDIGTASERSTRPGLALLLVLVVLLLPVMLLLTSLEAMRDSQMLSPDWWGGCVLSLRYRYSIGNFR